MSAVKPHVTVTFTEEMLRALDPCSPGFNAAQPFLPATLSTDPLENLELAELLPGGANLLWLCTVTGDDVEDECLGTCCLGKDPYVRAQQLAWVADVLATRDGR